MVTLSYSGADPAEQGDPPLPPTPPRRLYSGSLQREGTAREPCASPFSELQAGASRPREPQQLALGYAGGAGCPRRPHPRLALAPSL